MAKLKVNPVDIVIVLGVAALVWGVAVFSAPSQVIAKPGDPLAIYTVELDPKEIGFYKEIAPGATLYDSSRTLVIGTVVETYTVPYYENVPDAAQGVFKLAPVEGMEALRVVVEAPVQVSDYAIYAGQYDLRVGKVVSVRSRGFAGMGTITSVAVTAEP
jgi:hypothetical protein